MKMNIAQTISPAIKKISKAKQYDTKIALIGAGPASLSCATFLARLGYKDITIFERDGKAGGILAYEIPEFKLPYESLKYEIKLVQDLGVKFKFNQTMGKDFTLKSLKEESGYGAVFIGCGQSKPKKLPIFENLNEGQILNSKKFLKSFSMATKKGLNGTNTLSKLPKLDGHVVILGAGDTAIDCALSAYRCGAKRVSLVFRSGLDDMRCSQEYFEIARNERCGFVANCSPEGVIMGDNKIKALQVVNTIKGQDGNYQVDGKQGRQINCDHIITCVGAQVDNNLCCSLQIDKDQFLEVNHKTGQTNKFAWVFSGGNSIGSETVVEAVNDGKIAAAGIHTYLSAPMSQKLQKIPEQFKFPAFYTSASAVDLSTEFYGLKFETPFGLASGPGTENYGMIKRAFEMGWSWAVTKTCSFDEDIVPNVTPRIAKCDLPNSYINIELNADRTYKYWLKAIKRLKSEFPKKIIIAAITCKGDLDQWKKLAGEFIEAGPDALQLNFTCPNLNAGKSTDQEKQIFSSYHDQVLKVVKAIREISPIPLFPKLLANIPYGEITDLSRDISNVGENIGVFAVNSITALASVNSDATPYPAVGKKNQTAYGGLSGEHVKSFALKAISEIKQSAPKLKILGGGGIKTFKSALEMIHLGASCVGLCSSVMTYGFPIIDELRSGLTFHLYSRARKDLSEWEGQYPKQNLDVQSEQLFKNNEIKLQKNTFAESAPKVKEIVGKTLQHLKPFDQLNNTTQMWAKINYKNCIRCLRCYQSCQDSGSQAIKFSPKTNSPKINVDKCIGCMLCVSVCPMGTIELTYDKY
eukprot:Anaeramoba_flamelloidesa1186_112.p1 GENE.a1186_112~~a1186_112.p1  ORF type:complete len:816 (+),score=205.29 a1186_112:27-2450(+)